MGIPGFSSWFRRQYPEAFKKFNSKEGIDHLYIDLPSTLHIVTRKARTKTYFHQQLHARLDELLKATAPSRRVVLALDGPAPLAKLLEQRRRRRREADRASRPHHASKKKGSSSNISSLSITTGTLLMLEIHTSLACYICKRLSDPRYQHLEFELSDSTVKGEGELKILSRLLHQPTEGDDERHLVLGGDSDLLLMAAITGQKGVFICPDAPDSGLVEGNAVAFSRDALEAVWKRDILGPDATKSDVTSLALDLTLLSIMTSGNDYLPACQGLTLNNKHRPGIWPLYLDMRRQPEWKGQFLVNRSCVGCSSTDGDSSIVDINDQEGEQQQQGDALASSFSMDSADNVCDDGGPSVSVNREMLAALVQRYHDQRYVFKSESSLDSVTGSGTWDELSAVPPTGGFHSNRSSDSDSNMNPNLGRFPADPAEYLRGLEWVLGMYSTGAVQDYRWTYLGCAPSVLSFVEYLTGQNNITTSSDEDALATTEPATENDNQQEKVSGATTQGGAHRHRLKGFRNLPPLVPAACALALLPAKGRQHAATALRHLMDADSPVAEIYAVCKECQRLGNELSLVARDFDKLRVEFARLQSELSASAVGSDTPLEVESSLVTALEHTEAAQARLRGLLAELSRSQQDHILKMHPPSPFPTDELEAAVKAVPIDAYPRRERKLAKFGREMVFRWNPDALLAASSSNSGGINGHDTKEQYSNSSNTNAQQQKSSSEILQYSLQGKQQAGDGGDATTNGPTNQDTTTLSSSDGAVLARPGRYKPRPTTTPSSGNDDGFNNNAEKTGSSSTTNLPGWLHECVGFANAYPRVADADFVRSSATTIVREVLPLQPYMQPRQQFYRKQGRQYNAKQGDVNNRGPPTTMLLACQLRHFSSTGVGGYSSSVAAAIGNHNYRFSSSFTGGRFGQTSRFIAAAAGGSFVTSAQQQQPGVVSSSSSMHMMQPGVRCAVGERSGGLMRRTLMRYGVAVLPRLRACLRI